MWSVAEAIDATTVVSLIGEAWSPKIAPEMAAPEKAKAVREKVKVVPARAKVPATTMHHPAV